VANKEWLFFNLSGRATRKKFALFALFYIPATLVIFGLSVSVDPAVYISIVALYIVVFIPMFEVSVKRFHDINLSGWHTLLGLVPYVNILVVLILLNWPGTKGKNRFGMGVHRPNPR
jgi:uncharacterized membrane protein YhaH (DUF805 family)